MDNRLLERRLDEVDETRGSGTALVSLYIAADKNLASVQRRMSQEKSEAANIKSDQNRKNVESAIDRVTSVLKQYDKTPENGLVVFSGVTNDDNVVDFVFDDLGSPLDYSDYTCDSKFHTEPLREQIAPKHTIGLAVVERGGAAIGELRGTQIIVHKAEESNVMGKHNAGGQSAVRFDRLIEEQKDAFFKGVRDDLKKLFVDEDNQPTVDGFVLGGTQVTVDNFVSDGFLPQPLQDVKVGGSYAVDIANEQSLEQLVNRAQDEIAGVVEQEEREAMTRFFRALHSDDIHATYGENHVEKALQYGAVDALLVSENVPRETIVEYTDKVENQGGELVVVSDNFTEGEQFWDAFDGIGALLRYQID